MSCVTPALKFFNYFSVKYANTGVSGIGYK